MPGNRKQKEAVAVALSARAGWDLSDRRTAALVEGVLTSGDWEEALQEMCKLMPHRVARLALPAVCKAAGILPPLAPEQGVAP